MSNSNFTQLIQMAKSQPLSQRFLLLFIKAEARQNKVQTNHQSGTLTPLMCVDKLPEELTNFEDLKKEADALSSEWSFVLITSMSGTKIAPPTKEKAGDALQRLANELIQGSLTAQKVILDRNEEQVVLA